MKMAAVIFCALLAATGASADIYTGAEQLARKAAGGGGGNNASQNPAPPVQPTPPPQNIPPPNPVLEATLKNISNLRVDFDAIGKLTDIKPGSPQKKLLLNDLTIAPQGAKPSSASISALADNLASAVAGKKAMQPQHAKLAQEIHAIFNSSHLSAAQQQAVFGDVQKILQDGGASADDAINVVSDIKTIATETK
jgi:hypothetical protein